jgi:hypothetical protein
MSNRRTITKRHGNVEISFPLREIFSGFRRAGLLPSPIPIVCDGSDFADLVGN